MNPKRTEGIVLHTLPFRDYDRIVTLFTLEMGVVKAIIRKSLTPKVMSTDPLTRAEFVLTAGKNDLMLCREISVLNQNLKLREKLSFLQAACDMAAAINQSQMLQKPAPELYLLFVRYLERLPVTDPQTLISSFYLKLLRYEGLLNIQDKCSRCHLETAALNGGESFCSSHAPPDSMPLTSAELSIVHKLNFSRSFAELSCLEIPLSLAEKIKNFFRLLR